MKTLKPRTVESSPNGAKENLKAIQKRAGFIPNLMATFANSPAVLNGYLSLDAAWGKSSLSAKERQLILLTASVENKCLYGVAAHSTLLKRMRVDSETIRATRNKTPLADSKLDALVGLTRELVTERGFVAENTKERFQAAGYGEVTLMEVLVGIALKTMSNYLDHLNPIMIDAVFQAEAQ